MDAERAELIKEIEQTITEWREDHDAESLGAEYSAYISEFLAEAPKLSTFQLEMLNTTVKDANATRQLYRVALARMIHLFALIRVQLREEVHQEPADEEAAVDIDFETGEIVDRSEPAAEEPT